jgi:hypothetical protein
MRFAKLKLTGFKSFVEPTELVIERGLWQIEFAGSASLGDGGELL